MRRTMLVCPFVLLGVACALGVAPLPPSAAAQKPEPAALKAKEYALRHIRLGNTFQSIRFKIKTGESWTISGERFEKIPETGPVPVGEYDVMLITDDNNWMAFRIDQVSGATWLLKGNRWVKVRELEEKVQ